MTWPDISTFTNQQRPHKPHLIPRIRIQLQHSDADDNDDDDDDEDDDDITSTKCY